MTRLHYISPSLLPSRSANSVHVVHQCNGLVRAGADISLYAKRTITKVDELSEVLQRTYGVDANNWQLVTFHSKSDYADTLRIAIMAAWRVLMAPRNELVLARNLYAAWLLATAHRPILFETHQLEYGVRKLMQWWIMTRPWVRTVVISDRLVACLEEHHGVRHLNSLVLHDAAPDGIRRLAPESRRQVLAELLKAPIAEIASWRAVCGYFGQLYAGRGIEVIEVIAAKRPKCLFLVYGGSPDLVEHRKTTAPSNLRYMGHVIHPVARNIQASVDVLFMPYQHSVSIGVKKHDTVRWMSPMKMFEYMASGVPIISSDLPVLREILKDGVNALLVVPDRPETWISALDRLIEDPDLASSLGEKAHSQYRREHTWLRRAQILLAASQGLR